MPDPARVSRFVVRRHTTSDYPPHSMVAWEVWDTHERRLVDPPDDHIFVVRNMSADVMPEAEARALAEARAKALNDA